MSCYLNSYHNCKNVQKCFTEKKHPPPFAFLTISPPPVYFAHWKFDSGGLPVAVQNQANDADKASVNTSCQAVSYLTCHVTIGRGRGLNPAVVSLER